MKVALYLEKINQEMIGNPVNKSKSIAEGCCIYVEWSKSCCVLDFSLKNPNDDATVLPEFILRSEEDGGMLWNPRSGAVYKLDKEGYNVLNHLENGLSEESIAKLESVDIESIKQFQQDFLETVKFN